MIGELSVPSRPREEASVYYNYNRPAYDLVQRLISLKGVRVLKNKYVFMRMGKYKFSNNKKLKLYIEIAFDESAIDKVIAVAKDDVYTQSQLVSELAGEISAEYGIDEDYMKTVLYAFVEALNRANISKKGKNTCSQLKELRRLFAATNGIEYEEEDCTYEGPCEGTCPYCDSKTKELLQKAEELNKVEYPHIEIDEFDIEKSDDREELVEGMMEEFDDIEEDETIMEDCDDTEEEEEFMMGTL